MQPIEPAKGRRPLNSLVIAVLAVSSLCGLVAGQSLTWIGPLPGAELMQVTDICADGPVLVGWDRLSTGVRRALRWSPSSGFLGLGTIKIEGLPDKGSRALGTSADGTMVVGTSNDVAFLWTTTNGFQNLAVLYAQCLDNQGMPTEASALSADGRYIVGTAMRPYMSRYEAFLLDTRPEQGKACLTFLGTLANIPPTLAGGVWSSAADVSDDGSVVVGRTAVDGSYSGHAFRWTATGGMEDLGSMGFYSSQAYAVSADGSVVVGTVSDAAGPSRAFRWTRENGMQDLGTLGGALASARDVSADGSIIVGGSWDARGISRACRWTPGRGIET